jgi:10-carbomethoxy-13-deoxycarminomycin esterase/esterase
MEGRSMPKRFITSGDVRLWVEDVGDVSAEPILLIAGANAPASMWPDPFVALLAEGGFRVIRYDHRDTGRSTVRAFEAHPYAVADLADDAVAVLDGLGINRAHVAGLSMGGTIAQLLAIDHPGRLLSLTVMLTAALDVDFAGSYDRAMRGEPPEGDLPTPRPEVVARLAQMFSPGETAEAEIERRVEQWRVLSGPTVPFDAVEFRTREAAAIEHAGTITPPTAHAFAAPVPTERGRELARVRTPTLVIQGGQDPLNPPPHGRHLADLIPGARLVEVPALGHALPSAAVKDIASVLLRHVARRGG